MRIKNLLVTFLSIIAAAELSGCFTYYKVPYSNFTDSTKHNHVEITLKDGQNIPVNREHSIVFNYADSTINVQTDSTSSEIPVTMIENIKEENFDYGKTFFAVFWLGLLSFLIIGIIFAVAAGPLRFGG